MTEAAEAAIKSAKATLHTALEACQMAIATPPTTTSASTRNFAFGRALGQGHPLAELRAPDAPLAEGADTAPALLHRARKHAIELPIAETLAALLRGQLTAGDAIVRLMTRPLKQE